MSWFPLGVDSSNATSSDGLQASFLEAVPYHYVPTTWICGMILGLFSLSTVIHLSQGIWFRIWWTVPSAVLAGVGEIIGWSARLWSSRNPVNMTPFIIQISSTIIAPTLLVAANFIVLAQVIRRLGTQYSRLTPTLYSVIFCSFDLVALTVQAVGGALAAIPTENYKDPTKGGHIMLGGIVFQMVTLTTYAILIAEFLMRYNMDKPIRPSDVASGRLTRNLKLQLVGLCLITFFVYVRSIYRAIELVDGWYGVIISTQWYFNVWDGGMIVLAMFTLNLFHPGVFLKEDAQAKDGLLGIEPNKFTITYSYDESQYGRSQAPASGLAR